MVFASPEYLESKDYVQVALVWSVYYSIYKNWLIMSSVITKKRNIELKYTCAFQNSHTLS